MGQSGLNRAIKSGQAHCSHYTRATLISMQEVKKKLECRKALYQYVGTHFSLGCNNR